MKLQVITFKIEVTFKKYVPIRSMVSECFEYSVVGVTGHRVVVTLGQGMIMMTQAWARDDHDDPSLGKG